MAITPWLPGYEHRPVPGAGLDVYPAPDKIILHTTESPPGSLEKIIADFLKDWNSGLPHFVAEGTRYVQLLPLTRNAYTLENHPGGADTNRAGHVIQVEIVHYADNPFSEVEYQSLGKWIADVLSAGIYVDYHAMPRFYGAGEGIVLASYDSPIRLSADGFTRSNTVLGHQHAPENAHYDPGPLNTAHLISIIDAYVHASTGDEIDMATIDDLRNVVRSELAAARNARMVIAWDDKGAYACDGLLARPLSAQAEVDTLKFLGVKDIGKQALSWWSLFTKIPHDGMA